MDVKVPTTPKRLANKFQGLKRKRYEMKRRAGKRRRVSLSSTERKLILRKTDGRCHICGGKVGRRWQADHVLAHSTGGPGEAENYLATHPICNNYRWDYLPEEFQLVMKLGVWVKTLILKETSLGMEIADRFLKHERRREGRRQTP